MFQRRPNNIQRELPTKFPTAVVYRHPAGNLDFQVPDLVSFLGFMKNAGGMEHSALSGLLVSKGKDAVVSVEELKSALRTDATWREPFISEKDGERRKCGFCTTSFQPMTGPEFTRSNTKLEGGSFGTVKLDFIEKRLAGAKPEMADRVRQAGKEFTAEVVGDGEFKPVLAFAIPTCPTCREMFVETPVTFVRISSVIPALTIAEEKLNLAVTVGESQRVLAELTGVRPPRQYGNRATGGGVHRDNNHDRGRSDFRDDRVDWHGAKLRQLTATALTVAGYTTPQAALAAAENGELTTKGIANERSLTPITNALRMAIEGRMDSRPVAGEVSGAVVAPGAAAPLESATPVRTRPRTMVVRSDKAPAKSKSAGKSPRRAAEGASVSEAFS